jgi:hypothetical protein
MRKAAIAALLTASLGAAGCATYHEDGYGHRGRYGGYDYSGGDYDRLGNDCDSFSGSGGDLLDPWLACTSEGQDLVRRMFDKGQNRRISTKTADRANVWFRRHADHNRDLRLTDPEIKAALVNHARHSGMQARRY